MLLLLAFAQTILGQPTTESRGGSNYFAWKVDCINNYGVIAQYHTATATIGSQLQSMFNGGQRRLRIPILFRNLGLGGPDSDGANLNSAGGYLTPQMIANLTSLLTKIKQVGFEEVVVSFHPQAENNPTSWAMWEEDIYQENWNLIVGLHPIIANAGIPYLIDLRNEGMPALWDSIGVQYAQRLWNNYSYSSWGKADTVGFSMVPEQWAFDAMSTVYAAGDGYPYLFDVHIYGGTMPSTTWGDTHPTIVGVHNALTALGLGGYGIIVGEGWYDDPTEAYQLKNGIAASGQLVYFFLQWPLHRTSGCPGGNNDVVPTSFGLYIAEGF